MSHKLEVENLQISFRTQNGKVQAVRNISFSLEQGETLCIVGESGSGKSVTSKAIIGILAGNSIVEGGKIIYDGKDLLKIDAEDMHNIRGDKISMIFQDPMSSLNPIMRVGEQITEAMLLKNKSRRKDARNNFNTKLALLKNYLDLAYPEEKERNATDCKSFDSFCILNTKLELEYNRCLAAATEAVTEINNLLFLMEKNQKIDFKKCNQKISKLIEKAYHRFVLVKNDESAKATDALSTLCKKVLSEDERNVLVEQLTLLKQITEDALAKEKPNFFTIAYGLYKNPQMNMDQSVLELNEATSKQLYSEFMDEFLIRIGNAYRYEFSECLEKKKSILPLLEEAMSYIQSGELDYKKLMNYHALISPKVEEAKNLLSVTKNSLEYTFSSAYLGFVHAYFQGVKNNPINQKKHDKMQEKYDALKAKGKEPDWKVTPASITDLGLQKSNLFDIVKQLYDSYNKESLDDLDESSMATGLIEYFKAQASQLVNYITRGMAKAKAIKLLKEVGIPDPELRYKQYPFEFSGGMRQRIVIAIALAADPEVLICDEPTTALDVTIQSQILELINRIKEERKLSVIFITHNLGVVANTADRVAVMYAGKIVEYGTVNEIFYDPRHPYTWALLSSMPDLDTKTELEAINGTPPNMIYPPKGDAFADRNKYAMEIDFELEPPLFEVTPTHFAATWLLHPNAPKVDIPVGIVERIERMKKRMSHDE